MTGRTARLVVVLTIGAATAMVGIAVAGAVALRLSFSQVVEYYEFTNAVIGASLVGCGAVIAWFARRNPIGWLFLGAGLAHLTTISLGTIALLLARSGGLTPAVDWLATLGGQIWGFGVTGLFLVALLLFPNGRLPSRPWWAVVGLITLSGLGQFVEGLLAPGPVLPGQLAVSPVALAVPAPEWVLTALNLVAALASAGTIASLIVRYVRGDEQTRRQLLWLTLAMIAILVLNLQRFITGTGPILLLLTFVLVPVAIAIAIVRYGLLDIRLVVSRTITYVVLLILVTALFAGTVAALGLVLPTAGDRVASIVAAIAVGIAFAPLRSLLIRTVGRALYGRRADPAGIAARLSGELAGATDSLGGALTLIRAELRLPYLALAAGSPSSTASSGEPADASALVPLPVAPGAGLTVGLRRGERALHPDDRRALELLSVPLVVADRALALGAEVAEARTQVVTERERERQRLQRELHDGVGPRLTGVAFRLDAATNVVRDPDRMARLLSESRAELRRAIGAVRDVVRDLRPIELDEGGLGPALQGRIAELAATAPLTVHCSVGPLPPLSAAVEVAIFRVGMEAVTNAVRHSTGAACTVELGPEGDVVRLRVGDDGPPPEHWRPGVGLSSMRHRTTEVGGSFDAGPRPAGWVVEARSPAGA